MRVVVILLLTLVMGGCAHMQGGQIGLEQIRAWLDENEYGNALVTLRRQIQTNPNDETLRKLLQTARQNANDFARDRIAEANLSEQQNQWDNALQQIDNAREYWPQSAVLRIARDQLEVRRQHRIEQLQLELLLHEGKSLLETASQYRELEQANPDYLFLNWNLRKYKTKRRSVARQLLNLGEQVQKEGDLRLAQHCLIMAQRLEESVEVEAALQRLPQITPVEEIEEFQPVRHRPVEQYTSSEQSAFRNARQKLHLGSLLREYAQVHDKNDLVAAQRIMLQMLEINPEHPRVQELKAEQDVLIRHFVKSNTARGDDLYSQERIEQAIKMWQKALRLAPLDKDLLNKLDRAKTALETLREIKQSPR